MTGQAKLARGQKGLWREIGKRMLPSLRYISSTEVHAYAFSIAANAYLCFFPFTLLLLTVCRRWLGWESASRVILELLQIHLPKGADSILRNISQLAAGRPRLQLISVFVLFFTSSGVFLPLEVALNKVWSVPQNRSFLKNQVISLFLAVTTGLMALLSILLSAAAQWVLIHSLGWILAPGLVGAISRVLMETLSVPLAVATCFVIYFFLPNTQVPVAQVLPAAMVGGVLTEVGKLVYMLTLPLFRFREVYGPYETSATLLFWAYGAAMMLLFGAHLSAHGVFIPLGGESAASASATIDDLET
ncbi:MAG: YihY/virulence factor BrkB family protein [Terriglobia bacterium]